MIYVIRDNQDRLQAVIEWFLVDPQGRVDPNGRKVFVHQLHVNPGRRGMRYIQAFIHEIARQCPQVTGAYWERRDKRLSKVRGYSRQQLVNFGRRDADAAVVGTVC